MTKRQPNGRTKIYLGKEGYQAYVTMGVKNDGSLDRRHRRGKTASEVADKVKELEEKRDAGHVPSKGKAPTVEQWITTYLDTIAVRKRAPRTYDDYWSKARTWIIPGLGQHRLDRLQPEHLDALYSEMEDSGKAPSHILKVHRILSRALKIAHRRGHVPRNVATLVDAPSASTPEMEPFSREETRSILAAADGRPNAARWSVGLGLGLRQGEALGLRWACAGTTSSGPGVGDTPISSSARRTVPIISQEWRRCGGSCSGPRGDTAVQTLTVAVHGCTRRSRANLTARCTRVPARHHARRIARRTRRVVHSAAAVASCSGSRSARSGSNGPPVPLVMARVFRR